MNDMILQIDLPALLIATMAAIICSLCGAFLVLRRQALMSDALSHVVLPGIVTGYLVSGTIAALPMLLGALGACLLAVSLMALIRRVRIIESGAIMGIVFTTLFALGVLLLEQKVGGRVHLDAHHALYGALELTYWPGIFTPDMWQTMPADMPLLFFVMLAVTMLVLVFYKELKLATFDPLLAQGQGLRPAWVSAGLLALSAVGCVAAFQAVGSILVIALFICPAACARLLTSSLAGYLCCSASCAILMAVIGYGLAATAPLWLGIPAALSAAGMIAVTGGVMVALAACYTSRT
ncbi:MAG: metal ABC transporter permease [Alphaproteobacteria bacterium]|nr:metal ABC transporter permease [Alphaproteobacteria bacterium]